MPPSLKQVLVVHIIDEYVLPAISAIHDVADDSRILQLDGARHGASVSGSQPQVKHMKPSNNNPKLPVYEPSWVFGVLIAQAARASDVRVVTEACDRPCLQPDGSAKPWSAHFRSENDCGPAESNDRRTARSRTLSQTAMAATANASTATPSFQGEESVVAPPMTRVMPPMTPMQERSMSRTASASV